jgi:hypothetical protein
MMAKGATDSDGGRCRRPFCGNREPVDCCASSKTQEGCVPQIMEALWEWSDGLHQRSPGEHRRYPVVVSGARNFAWSWIGSATGLRRPTRRAPASAPYNPDCEDREPREFKKPGGRCSFADSTKQVAYDLLRNATEMKGRLRAPVIVAHGPDA